MPDDILKGRTVLIEFSKIGNLTKVSAFDEKTLTEVSISGPSSCGEEVLRRNAIKRLEYVLRKKGEIE
ncbi:MAG: hypothetical protein JNN09_01875 [Alphaproteobacteria bacterium]|nr:hypothetical protein [Alphaproteobacteria bacterium]MBP9049680.1 hypothetical protein [Alphaproteobacteria bacterium]MBP9868327.1 hypothetical protein [Alphaproteobacteria bacterium]